MKRKSKVYEEAVIQQKHHKGKFLADVKQKVAVRNAVPGDVVDARIVSRRKKCRQAVIDKVHVLSSVRVSPFCEHFGVCGGCRWQNIGYENQLRYKQDEIGLLFTELTSSQKIQPIISCEQTQYFRNKVNFSFSHARWLTEDELDCDLQHKNGVGFHVSGRYDKVVDLQKCYLQTGPSNDIRLLIRDYAREKNWSFYNIHKNEGFIRSLVIRNTSNNEFMVIVVVAEKDCEEIFPLLQLIQEKFSDVTSIFYAVNLTGNDSLDGVDIIHFWGQHYITEYLNSLQFAIGPRSFFQTNTQQCLRLYEKILDFANFTGQEVVYDLYTGVGSIALFIAKYVQKVVGIDYVEDAIDDARKNATLNDIKNAQFVAGNVQEMLNSDFVEEHGSPEIVIVDPAREGMRKKTCRELIDIAPQKIIYVSCNPKTQVEDLELLAEKYAIEQIQPVDMFPHTHHIENIVLLVKVK
ncbi:23S rRNA (uracil(1939)-C(5))-methyltransferase RlmD [Candidatus Uabimicrobium amorphum]|uniref:23S rRNA (Uracil-5-)-methyltransferase RumA n=1 Tax=Uabimicrobium amorphum TaxID=2596890 RepID=A0A5S9IML5_UABAM|nr:23S rRNA (uracil(1939)-C(5))-methyltransferase RlmD [Candidatus Uabimicrobium amorphum]BBM83820.1 23S rRNA (uracil-5-)-methyltransferase RumA [Candidatus Uabimicrobium amorphum]